MKNIPWIEKYRPNKLCDVISHSEVILTLQKFIHEKSLPHILLYGPSGTGKTSTITACARQLYGDSYPFMTMELNASDDRGIDMVRTKIKQFVMTKSNVFCNDKSLFKLVILDETDAMTKDAQAILRKIIEMYTSTTRFCLICNYIQNIDAALQSRCQRFRFAPLNPRDIKTRVKQISESEGIDIDKSGIMAIIDRSKGDMRKILNNLQSVSMVYDKQLITDTKVNTCLGYPTRQNIENMLKLLEKNSFKQCYDFIIGLKTEGICLNDLVTEVYHILEEYIINGNLKYVNIIEELRFIEYNQTNTSNDNIQIAAFVGIYKKHIKK